MKYYVIATIALGLLELTNIINIGWWVLAPIGILFIGIILMSLQKAP